jgi:hypothetical protein
MTETHVVSALRAKRAEISGHIHELEKKIGRLRASLLHIDVSLGLFPIGANPDDILPKRPYWPTRYFAACEFSRRRLDTLREATALHLCAVIDAAVIFSHEASYA